MFYFRYRVLNSLRDELLLTRASAKMTLFMMLSAWMPIGGIGVGIAAGVRTHSVLRGIVTASIGLIVGAWLGWMLPRAIWNMLGFFGRRGWFLQPEPASPATILSPEEFLQRSEALNRDASRASVWWVTAFIAWAIGGLWLMNYFPRDSEFAGIVSIIVMGLFATLALWIVLAHRRLVKLHGLACPSCNRELSDTAGGGIVVTLGFCRNCGVKVIDVDGCERLPPELDMS